MGDVVTNDREANVPLARLFLSAAGILVDGLHDRLAQRGWSDVRHSWGFVLIRVGAEPASVNELAAFLGVSKQAASKTIEHMQLRGLVRMSPSPEDGRRKMIEMTGEGERFLKDVETVYEELEGDWGNLLGRHELENMRQRLTALLMELHGGTIPPPAPLK
jgi:DNA-binding MarR family transcriptional regulator